MKRILILFLMSVTMLGALPISALASTPYITPTIITDAEEPLSVGELVTVTVHIDETSGYTGLSLKLVYDSDVFNLVEAVDLGTVSGAFPTPYDYTMFWTNPLVLDDFTYTGPIAQFTLEVVDTPDDESIVSAIIADVVNGVPEDGVGGTATCVVALNYVCEHTYDNGVVTTNPTCEAPGVKTYTCSACGDAYTDTVSALGHDILKHDAAPPTCTKTGHKAYETCSRCDYSTYVEIAATGHSYDGGVITTDPTCEVPGVKTYTCSACGDAYTDTVSALGHDILKHDAAPPTCTKTGHKAYESCSRCDYSTYEEIAVAGHSYDNGVITTEPTYTSEGVKTYTCGTCGATYNESIPVLETVLTEKGIDIKKAFMDKAFRSFVTGYDTDKDGYLSESEIAEVTYMDVSYCSISSLAGIEYFTALEELRCENNELTVLDISSNIALTTLECSENKLVTLNVSTNTALTTLNCCSNRLTELDVSKNTALVMLTCYDNQLTELNIRANTELKYLDCSGNPLGYLDVSKNTSLRALGCISTQLAKLDIHNNKELESLACYANPLTSLDVSANMALISLDCRETQLTDLNLNNNPNLSHLACASSMIGVLDISKNPVLCELVSNSVSKEVTYDSVTGGTYQALSYYYEISHRPYKASTMVVSPTTIIVMDDYSEQMLGDVTNDGNVRVDDLVVLMKYIVGTEDSNLSKTGDINCDNNINILDVIALMRILAA